MCQTPWLVHSGWIISNIKCLLSSTPAHSIPYHFANVRDADTCFDFDLVNQNCSSGRSWSRSGQQGDGAQVSPETHISLGEPLFSVVPPVALGAAAHRGGAGAGQSRTWHTAFHKTSPWSLVKMEVPYCQHASVISEVGCVTTCVTAGVHKVCFAGDTSKFILCFCVADVYLLLL